MQKIKQLPPHEAQKIAAGEVVERPTNVIKELIENAIDAGATHIIVSLEHAGSTRITITDNGCGMSQEDARLCIAQYATSKISCVNDLETIATFGFRGEALASIAAVSRMSIHTKEIDTQQGIALTIEQGAIVHQEPVACNTGTTIHIHDLFYNVPARKKFLKKKETEWRCIQQLFQAFCLDHLSVHFTLEHDGRTAYNCPSVSSLHERVTQLWDHAISNQMISLNVENQSHAIRVHGIISHHQYGRYDRSALFVFVNKRWIKNHALTKALLKGYANVIPTDRYPAACIHIDVDPRSVDINIHPRKEEVQFIHPRVVEQLIQSGVKQALEEHLSAQLNKQVTFAQPEATYTPSVMTHSAPLLTKPVFAYPGLQDSASSVGLAPYHPLPAYTLTPVRPELIEGYGRTLQANEQQATIINDTAKIQEYEVSFTIIGQYHNTYILIEQENGLFMIDQHAAHERILYEQFAQRFDNVPTINLLFPQIVQLSEQEITNLEKHTDLFARNGIIVERFGTNQMIVQSVPVHCKTMSCEELLRNVASWIGEHRDGDEQQLFKVVNEKLHTQMACKAAIKAGDQLSIEQMRQLITDLNKTEHRFSCPHGRPTGWLLSLTEIEKHFKRDYR
ncbi:MAG: DNA mismatch repair endonuclease MutL [Candidatus Babeliales bacterium]